MYISYLETPVASEKIRSAHVLTKILELNKDFRELNKDFRELNKDFRELIFLRTSNWDLQKEKRFNQYSIFQSNS